MSTSQPQIVEVALGVFDDPGGFGHLDGTRLMGAGGDDAAVEGIDKVSDFGGGAELMAR